MFLHHEAEKTADWLMGWDVDPILLVLPLYFLLWLLARLFDADGVAAVFATLVGLSPILLPFGLFVMFWKRWIHYIRFATWFKQEYVLLKIELPPEVTKSPSAMELFLTSLHFAGGEGNFIARIWDGKFMPVHSLELVGEEGRISYYLRILKSWKDFTESRLYGQFPEARVTEVDDYVSKIKYDPKDYGLYGLEYKKNKSDVLPLKTYVDWELNLQPDTPETKVDPLTNIFELMQTLGPGERLWLQIIIHAHRSDQWYGFPIPGSGSKFNTMATEEIKKITEAAIKRSQSLLGESADSAAKARVAERGPAQLTQGEGYFIGAIERGMGKLIFDCGIRGLYLAPTDKFKGARIGQLIQVWAPFKNGQGGQTLSPTRGMIEFNYPWRNWQLSETLVKKQLFFWYKHRAYFYGVPLEQDYFMITTEELASLWHFPSSQVKTPGLERVPSRVSEAPLNLPTAAGPINLPQ